MKYRKFVQQACSLEALKATSTYKAIEAADKGDLSLLKPWVGQVATTRIGGYEFDYSEHCKRFLVNEKYRGWAEYQAVNKTCVRNLLGKNNVLEIYEIPKKNS